MPIENFSEIPAYLEANKDNEAVKSFVAGLNPINIDRIKDFVGKDATAKSWLDSEKDKHSNKSLETWKTNNLQKLLDDAVAKSNPQETPEQKKIRELEEKIKQSEGDALRKDLMNNTLKMLQEKKLPIEVAEFLLGKDETATTTNIETFEKIFNEKLEGSIEERLKSNSYIPPLGGNSGKEGIGAVIAKTLNQKTGSNKYADYWNQK